MSQVTEQSVRFQTALASIKLIQASAVLDLTEDDFDFLTSNKVWIATDRSRARRCVEACVDRKSGSAGMPRPTSYAVFCLKKKKYILLDLTPLVPSAGTYVHPVQGTSDFGPFPVFFSRHNDLRDLHSFPTRRSSDLHSGFCRFGFNRR